MKKSWTSSLLKVGVYLSVAVILFVYGSLLFQVFVNGVSGLSWEFISSTPGNAGREGGILPIIVSTVLILMVCFASVLPIGLGAAMWLSHQGYNKNSLSGIARYSLDVLAGVPSIVFGLFGNILFCQILGLGFSILSGGLTLACMVLPIFIRTAEQSLRQVPMTYRQAGYASGLSKTSVMLKIVLPVALPGLAAGLILGIGRAIAETAALIFTSGYVYRMPESLMDSGRSLSIHIYDLAMNVPGANSQAYTTALLLMIIVVLFNLSARKFLERNRQWI